MPKYLCLQRSLPAPDAEPPAPGAMKAMAAEFGAWMARFEGQLVDPGGKLGQGTVCAHSAQPGEAATPFSERVGGYMIVEAPDLEGALEVVRACPGLIRPGSGCEVIAIGTP